MKKILFLTDTWSPQPTANAICVKNIARVLQQRGWEIYANAFAGEHGQKSETQDGIHIEYTRPALSRQLITKSNFVSNEKWKKIVGTCGVLFNRVMRLFFFAVLSDYGTIIYSFMEEKSFKANYKHQKQPIRYQHD